MMKGRVVILHLVMLEIHMSLTRCHLLGLWCLTSPFTVLMVRLWMRRLDFGLLHKELMLTFYHKVKWFNASIITPRAAYLCTAGSIKNPK